MAGRPNNRLATAPLLDGVHGYFTLLWLPLGEEFLRLCGLGCLDLAKEDGELFLGDLVATQ